MNTNLIEELIKDGATPQQAIVSTLVASSLQADETANEMFISPNTARMHIKNHKATLGYNNNREVTGYVICKYLGLDYNKIKSELREIAKTEVKRRILTTALLCISLYGMYNQVDNTRYYRVNNRRNVRTEILTRRNEY